MYSKALVNPCLSMLYRPFGDLSRVWQYYVGPLVTIAVFGYVKGHQRAYTTLSNMAKVTKGPS